MLLIILLWPGAVIFACSSACLSYLVKTKAKHLRMSAGWTRLGAIPNMVIVVLYIAQVLPSDPFGNAAGRLLFDVMLALLVSRVIQLALIDQYVAHIESVRWTRGWDGLVTSISLTQDNKKDIVESRFAEVKEKIHEDDGNGLDQISSSSSSFWTTDGGL